MEWHLLWAQFALSEVLLRMHPSARKPQSLGQVVKLPCNLCKNGDLGDLCVTAPNVTIFPNTITVSCFCVQMPKDNSVVCVQ
jgi:hypothetical protein